MKRAPILVFVCLTLTLAVTPQGPKRVSESLARRMPPGALVYLEARDFQSLASDWNNSKEKQLWLASDNYQVFSRSRLFIKLEKAQNEFASASGFPPDMSFLDSVAGGRSALGIYDIGHLEFLYLTAMPSARAMESLLWKVRTKFEPRMAGGMGYFIHTDPASHRAVAFATTGDFLIVSTREDLMVRALELYSPNPAPALFHEKWFEDASKAAAAPGDLRLVLNMQALVRSPYFRSYWVERNVPELRQYEAEIADLHRAPSEIREDRVLVRMNSAEASSTASPDGQSQALGEILRFVPEDAGLYRAWQNPSADQALDLIERKILSPRLGPVPPSQWSPSVALGGGEVGTESDLETRIDIAPVTGAAGGLAPEALKKLLVASPPGAVLQIESTRPAADGVLVGTESTIVLSAAKDWDDEAARAALESALGPLWTTSQLGVKWIRHVQDGRTYVELDGLNHITMAAEGRFLMIATGPKPLLAALLRSSEPAASETGVYAAGFRHARERQQLVSMLRLVEKPEAERPAAFQTVSGRPPLFFSENLASLSGALARVESESIVVKDQGDRVTQTVRYELAK